MVFKETLFCFRDLTNRIPYYFLVIIFLFSCSKSDDEIIPVSFLEDYNVSNYSPLTVNSHTSEGGLAVIDKNTIMVVYRKDISLSHISNTSQIVAKISSDNGGFWGNEFEVYNSPYDDRNLIVGNLPNGNIIVVFRRYNADTKQTIDSGYIISDDKGRTWGEYIKILNTEGTSNQPFGNIIINGNGVAFLINYDNGIAKKYSSLNNFSTAPKETIIVNDPSKILQEPFLVNLSNGRSIVLFRNGDGNSGQSSYYQYNSTDGIAYTYKGETNIFDDFDQPVRSPVSLRYDADTNELEVCTNSRFLTYSDKNIGNELRIYRQDADVIFNDQKKYELKHTVSRPFPSNHWFYGYPKHLNVSKNEVIYIITDSKINNLDISPLSHITNEQANLYTFKVSKNH